MGRLSEGKSVTKNIWTREDDDWPATGCYISPEIPYDEFMSVGGQLAYMHTQYTQGDKFALMSAIRLCAASGTVMPPWVAFSYAKAFDAVDSYEYKSWGDVFGSRVPKGAHLNAAKKKHKLAKPVYLEATEII